MRALRLLPWIALAVAIAVGASGYGNKLGLWDYRAAFEILKVATYAAIGIAAIALVLLLVPRTRRGHAAPLGVTVVLAFAALALPLYWLQLARTVPPINDITTDVADPPEFVAILPVRASAPVPATYAGKETAEAQRKAYPDIAPIALAIAPQAAFARALAIARDQGWTIVAADEKTGRIEATATTAWFGFRDDVVIRVRPDSSGSRVDLRSVSRVGKSDLGANAKRIRDFSARLRS
ncbi:MAG: DUF1499 domain-containing protein [Burkholderiales bacterium]